jgi:hypothetical protein
MLLNGYPPDIRTKFDPMKLETRKIANIANLPLLFALLAVIVLVLAQLRRSAGEPMIANMFIITTSIFQVWNLLDLLVLDWFIHMTLRPSFVYLETAHTKVHLSKVASNRVTKLNNTIL